MTKTLQLPNSKTISKNEFNQLLKKQSLETADNLKVFRPKGYNKLPTSKITPFQNQISILRNKNLNYLMRNADVLINTLLFMPDMNQKALMFSESENDILNSYNDPVKRFFETYLTKQLLCELISNKNISNSLKRYINAIHQFLVQDYKDSGDTNYLNKIIGFKKNKIAINSNSMYYQYRKDFEGLINSGHFGNAQNRMLLLDLFDQHYLTHRIEKHSTYKKKFPNGILNIYGNNTKFFIPENRGRVYGLGFNIMPTSYHLGIIRLMDPSCSDLTKNVTHANIARCPDRLYISNIKTERNNKDNWLQHAFNNPNNSCFVNGLSGSMLLEVRNVLYFNRTLKKENHTPYSWEQVKYFLMNILGLFVYFEGGHTISEVLSLLDLKEVRDELSTEFPESGIDETKPSKLIMSDSLFKRAFAKATQETIIFQETLENKYAVLKDIRKHKWQLKKRSQKTSPPLKMAHRVKPTRNERETTHPNSLDDVPLYVKPAKHHNAQQRQPESVSSFGKKSNVLTRNILRKPIQKKGAHNRKRGDPCAPHSDDDIPLYVKPVKGNKQQHIASRALPFFQRRHTFMHTTHVTKEEFILKEKKEASTPDWLDDIPLYVKPAKKHHTHKTHYKSEDEIPLYVKPVKDNKQQHIKSRALSFFEKRHTVMNTSHVTEEELIINRETYFRSSN